MTHPALTENAVAVVTGAAAGIGLAAAANFAARGMKVCLADLGSDALASAAEAVARRSTLGADAVLTVQTDVSDPEALIRLERAVADRFGGTDVLMNNAGVQPGSTLFGTEDNWARVLDVNLWGVIHGTRAFGPGMIARGRPGLIVNTGSKQGITTPPGDPAYNVSKAGVKVFTEALAHELRSTEGCKITAHLLIPGYVFTGLTARGRTEKPDGAWTPEQTARFMMRGLDAGEFYILCPDNEVTRDMDQHRILWAAGDIVFNRPPLSRWHPDFGDAFAEFAARPLP